jgi:hypothetical protein
LHASVHARSGMEMFSLRKRKPTAFVGVHAKCGRTQAMGCTPVTMSPSGSATCPTAVWSRGSWRTIVANHWRLTNHWRLICATPSYLASRGTPMTPAYLDMYDCLQFTRLRRSALPPTSPTARPAPLPTGYPTGCRRRCGRFEQPALIGRRQMPRAPEAVYPGLRFSHRTARPQACPGCHRRGRTHSA